MKSHIAQEKIKISACCITKNEEDAIPRSIQSYKSFADEIIIVDTGSTDRTVEIAQSLGARVLHFDWVDDFSAAKNCALHEAGGDWIIFLDADEYFSENAGPQVLKNIREAERIGHNTLGVQLVSTDGYGGAVLNEFCALRVFKAGYHYEDPVHERPCRPEGNKVLKVGKESFYVLHTGYRQTIMPEKCRRNLEILLKNRQGEQNEATKITGDYYIADSYMGLQEYEKAIEYAKNYITGSKETGVRLFSLHSKAYENLIRAMEMAERPLAEVAPWVEEMYREFPDYPDAVFLWAHFRLRMRDFTAALREFERVPRLVHGYQGMEQSSMQGKDYDSYFFSGLCREGLGDPAGAVSCYFKALKEKGDHNRAMYSLLAIIRGMPQGDVDTFVRSLYSESDEARQLCLMAGLGLNYMSAQLAHAYAFYRRSFPQKPFLYDIAGFQEAGAGKFDKAAKMFAIDISTGKKNNSATRGLLCALFSGDAALVENLSKMAGGEISGVLGVGQNPPPTGKIGYVTFARVIAELFHMGRPAMAEKVADRAASVQEDGFMRHLVEQLEDTLCFTGALCCAQRLPAGAETDFLCGYFLYRTGQREKARVRLLTARQAGYPGAELEFYLKATDAQ